MFFQPQPGYPTSTYPQTYPRFTTPQAVPNPMQNQAYQPQRVRQKTFFIILMIVFSINTRTGGCHSLSLTQ